MRHWGEKRHEEKDDHFVQCSHALRDGGSCGCEDVSARLTSGEQRSVIFASDQCSVFSDSAGLGQPGISDLEEKIRLNAPRSCQLRGLCCKECRRDPAFRADGNRAGSCSHPIPESGCDDSFFAERINILLSFNCSFLISVIESFHGKRKKAKYGME